MFDRKHPYVKGHAASAGLPGAVMLVYWGLSSPIYYEGQTLSNFANTLFFGMLFVGGIALLLIAALCVSGRLVAILADAIVSFACGAVMIGCAAIWCLKGIGIQDILFLIFGLMFCRNGLSCFDMYRRLIITAPEAKTASAIPSKPVAPPVPHPASQASSALPKDGEPPPPEGYLAALGKEKDD